MTDEMFECNLCQPKREFFTDIACEIHKKQHSESEQEVTNQIIEQEDKQNLNIAFDKLELAKNYMEDKKMGLFNKDEPQKTSEPEPNIIRSYLYELHLEVADSKDKKSLKVFEEINKKLLELMSDGYDIVLKHQKTEKQL